jgi:hypothetical protein
MTHAVIKTSVALLVLGGFAVAAPALALSPLPSAADPIVIPVQNEEDEEVWHDLRPDVTPPEAAVGNEDEMAPKEGMPEHPKEEQGGSGQEEKALQEDGLIPE